MIGRPALLLVCALLGAACVPFRNRAPDLKVTPTRLTALPISIEAYQRQSIGVMTERSDWENEMEANMRPELQRIVARHGGSSIELEDIAKCGEVCWLFLSWSTSAAMEIAAQKTGYADFRLYSVEGWRYRGNLGPVHQALRSDFALVVVFHDFRQTIGQAVLWALAGITTGRLTVSAACLTDLRDGRMIWCDARADPWRHVEQGEIARGAVQDVLTDLYGRAVP
jgi:hypothetical protein